MEPPGDEILLQQIGAAKYMNPHPVYNKKGKKALRGHQNLFEEFRRVGTMHFQKREQSTYSVQLRSSTVASLKFRLRFLTLPP